MNFTQKLCGCLPFQLNVRIQVNFFSIMNSHVFTNQTKVIFIIFILLYFLKYLFYKSFNYVALILNLLYNKNQNIPSSSSNTVLVEQQHQQQANSLIISQYQQIIREQDIKLKEYEQEKSSLVQTSTQLQEYCKSLHYALTAKDDYIKEKAHEFDIVSSEKLKLNAKINELEVKNNLLDEKYYFLSFILFFLD